MFKPSVQCLGPLSQPNILVITYNSGKVHFRTKIVYNETSEQEPKSACSRNPDNCECKTEPPLEEHFHKSALCK